MLERKDHIGYKRLSLITLVSVYFLILVGGVVRSSGSGMGCPDWPKCFGNWVPPTDVSDLPSDYKDYYASYRHKKNVRFAKYLQFFGMPGKADKIITDESILVEGDFNPAKTWTEYVNRLVGATVGLLIFSMFVGAIPYFKKDKTVFYFALLNLFLVGFQGWIGSIVVSTNLMPWIITLHMVLALLIVLVLIYINTRIRKNSLEKVKVSRITALVPLSIVCLVAMTMQIVLGTQVREAIDAIASSLSYAMRATWVSKLGTEFLIHRSFSILILGLHAALIYIVLKGQLKNELIHKIGKYLLILVIIEILSGAMMAYFGIPPFIQPVHLLFSTLIFGALYYLFLILVYAKKNISVG